MLRRLLPLLLLLTLLATSCIVQAPKYTSINQVLTLKLGMTKEEVSATLGIPPYDFKSLSDSGQVLIYKYRVTDRRTVPLFKKPANGIPALGGYVDLLVHYDASGKVVRLDTENHPETKETTTKLDVNKLITLLTVTVPAALLYLGIKLQ